MSTVKTVTVASIDQRPVKTRYGDKSAWGIRGMDGAKVDFAFKRPDSIGVVVGGTYDVLIETGKYGDELVKGSIPTPAASVAGSISAGATHVGTASVTYTPPTGMSAATNRFPMEPTDVGNIAVREVALQAAVRFWENRAIPATTDVSQQQEDVVKTAYAFADFISGQRESKAVASEFGTEDGPT